MSVFDIPLEDPPAPFPLTKRELFAAMALNGMCSAYRSMRPIVTEKDAGILARAAVIRADALIKELEKDPEDAPV